MTTAIQHGSPQFPAAASPIAASDQAALDAAVRDLQGRKDAWVAVSVRERIALVDRLIHDYLAITDRWVAACLDAKGIAPGSPVAGEEWGAGPYTILKWLRQLRGALADIASIGRPRIPGPVTTRPDGQVVARVFPQTTYDGLFFSGLTADVWMEPGVTTADLPRTQAVVYQDKQHPGAVALVLGAGNVSSIGPLDIFYKLFVEDQVVAYKSNPINAYLGPLMADAFRVLIEPGYLRLVYGAAAEGSYLCRHPGVDAIHITGSDKTFDAIVFGTGPDGAQRKAEGRPLLDKRITGELGNVSPVIVVPGPWSQSDLDYHAAHLVSMLTNNAGFNCNATRVIIQHAGWPQRDDLLRRVRGILAQVPPRLAYYPGAADRYQAFLAAHPEAERFGTPPAEGHLPWALIERVDAANAEDIVFTTEAFCSLFAETALDAPSAADYLDRAVSFCNEGVWGSLNATILIHPQTLKDSAVAAALERAVATLRYGNVGVNYWAGTSFVLGVTTWGAFPGHPLTDIQSGSGVVHNALMFSRPQKSVLRAPFRVRPVPPWFVTRGKAALGVFPRLARFEAAPSLAKVPAIFMAALRS
jgi:hypothetical protein